MSIVTKTGDKGQTGLYGSRRVSKTDPRIEAIGTVDELNALLGCIMSEKDLPKTIAEGMGGIQNRLFTMGADLATPADSSAKTKRMTAQHVQELEEWVTQCEAELPPLTTFILPSGSKTGSLMHLARAVCRRAERCVVALSEQEPLNLQIQIYLNRLSDLLFLLARIINRQLGAEESAVQYE